MENLPGLLKIADWQRSPVPYAFAGAAGPAVRVTGAVAAGEGDLGLLDWAEPHPPEFYHGQSLLYRSQEADAARMLLVFDRSLVGLRVRQILDFLVDHQGPVKYLQADRQWSVPLIFACALAGPALLPRAVVRYVPASFRRMLAEDLNTTGLGSIVPGLLAHGDIDDAIELCGARLAVEWRVDADGRVAG